MSVQTFIWIPSYASGVQYAPRIREFKAGDGYFQSSPDGINNFPLKYTLVFNKIRSVSIVGGLPGADVILAFLKARGGLEPFYWTPPDDNNGPYTSSLGLPAYLFVCKPPWGKTAEESNADSLEMTFDQTFNP